MALPTGLEPVTDGLEVHYSFQLNYESKISSKLKNNLDDIKINTAANVYIPNNYAFYTLVYK